MHHITDVSICLVRRKSWYQCTSALSRGFTCINSFIFRGSIGSRHYYYPHFTDEEIEAQIGQVLPRLRPPWLAKGRATI